MAQHITMLEASHMLWYLTRQDRTTLSILKWWVWCALELDCMAPPQSNLKCKFIGDHYKDYANCHRFDQSAINIIAAIVTNFNRSHYQLQGSVLQTVWQQ